MDIVDTHQHLWDLDRFGFAWCKGRPVLDRSFRIADYLEASAGLGISKSVFVEADVDQPYLLDEANYALELAARVDNPLAGVVAAVRPGAEGFRQHVEKLAGNPRLKGVRRILHTEPDETGTNPAFIADVALLAEYHLSFDICVLARQLPVAIHLVESCPGVSFILDHCANPPVRDKVFEPWGAMLREISAFPNIACKISGFFANIDPAHWQPEDLRPYIAHVISCFGWDRVMFGSDWPVCNLGGTMGLWVETLQRLTAHGSESERSKLFAANAERIYKLA
jgi:predicted TIM-barrel fold metal-dependent hydrolase